MNEENELLIRRAAFGRQVELFMTSPIGIYILERAQAEKEGAVGKLLKCDASNALEVTRLQIKAATVCNVREWLSHAVADGAQALGILEDRE